MKKWKGSTEEDTELIIKIAERAVKLYHTSGVEIDVTDTKIDIATVHQSMPLKLDKFLNGDTFNFCHDIIGIATHLNRDTGELEKGFLPRFTA